MSDFIIEDTIGYLINRSAIVLRQVLTGEFQKLDLDITPEEWAILNMLWIADGLTQSEIADKTFRDNSTVTRMIDKMAKKGFVRRKNDSRDRRMIRTFLLPKGKELKNILIPCAEKVLAIAVHSIPQENIDLTVNTLRQLIENMLKGLKCKE